MNPTQRAVPFNQPFISKEAEKNLETVVRSGKLSGQGAFGSKCCRWLENEVGCAAAHLTPSCTAALEMAALVSGLKSGDEILVPSFTFVTSISAFSNFGLRPIFVDVCPDTLNIDPVLLEAAVTPRTRAIVVVHYAGVACDMDAVLHFAAKHQLVVIEDAAHALTGEFRGRPLGSLGDLATLSFHDTKNFSCGEGGALLVNRRDWTERAQIVQDKGTNRSQFLRGETDKYTWVEGGSSYLLGELPAALLLANLEAREKIQRRRLEIWARYDAELSVWRSQNDVTGPFIPDYARHPAHIYYLIMPSAESMARVLQHLRAQGITASFHYQALNASPMGLKLGGKVGACPVSERLSTHLFRLPLYADMTDDQQDIVLESISRFKV
jgi:dTDP-4-amino-4,6-dideoxygalactose transaminase